jgi:hypothetical protein
MSHFFLAVSLDPMQLANKIKGTIYRKCRDLPVASCIQIVVQLFSLADDFLFLSKLNVIMFLFVSVCCYQIRQRCGQNATAVNHRGRGRQTCQHGSSGRSLSHSISIKCHINHECIMLIRVELSHPVYVCVFRIAL